MVKKNNKKGAVELSLNLIIMLIIGIVVLGLVITFVNNLIKKGSETYDSQLGDNEKLRLEDVKSCPENLCVNPFPAVSINKGSKINIFIKVRAFADDIDCIPGDLNACDNVIYEIKDESGSPDPTALLVSGPGFNAINGGEDSKMYTLRVAEDTDVGVYYLTLKLYSDDDNEETKTITVEVK